MERTYVYIDGESHFVRLENTWRSLHGPDAMLERLRYKNPSDDKSILLIPKAKVFWTRTMMPGAIRSVYFTSPATTGAGLHELNVELRNFDLEPHIIPEKSALAERRQNILRDANVIEKPKGVDIALSVRMLQDAVRGLFDVCHLYTSDVDFLPVIEAVMFHGKRVWVHGFKNGLARESPLLFKPDRFVDLGEMIRSECELCV